MIKLPPQLAQQIAGLAWGAGAGVVGSLCCLGPAAAALLGLGASSALAGAQLDRGLALALGAIIALAGLALAVRRGRACALSAARRIHGPLALALAFGLSYLLLAQALPAAAARQISAEAALTPPAPPAAATRQLSLSVAKMECPPCVAKVRSLLDQAPGVAAYTAVQDVDLVTVDYDPARVSAAELVALFPSELQATLLDDAPLP